MTARETLDCIELIGANWPNWIAKLSDRQLHMLAETWATLLGDLDAALVRAAIAQYLCEAREWPPTVGQINTLARDMLARASGEDAWDAARAWREVCRALEAFGYGVAWVAERKAALPAYVVRAAEDYGLSRILMRLEENAGTDFAQFRDIFNARHNRERQNALMPPAVRQVLAGLATSLGADRKRLPDGGR